MASQAGGSSFKPWEKGDPAVLLERLHMKNHEVDNLIWEEEVDDPGEAPKWLAMAQLLLTTKSCSQSSLTANMKAAWNPAREVVWRRIDANLFYAQFH